MRTAQEPTDMPLKNVIDSRSERLAAPVPAAQGAEVNGPQPVGDQTQGSTVRTG
jgi:hypothetical protein